MKTEIRDYILKQISVHPNDIATVAAREFKVSRQTTGSYLTKLIEEGLITATGNTKARKYEIRNFVEQTFSENVFPGMAEDIVWRDKIMPLMNNVSPSVVDICQYGFTEIFNNVIDHSESKTVFYSIIRNAVSVKLTISDEGVGIFNKIQKDFNLNDPRHALFELSKGKLTSDPKMHSGQGIFFTSRMFDEFMILSNPLFYRIENKENSDEWLMDVLDSNQTGTVVQMVISTYSTRTSKSVFDEYAPGEGENDYDFSRTHVPIKLARYEGEQLVSRSQAKRMLARFERFRDVILDFKGITSIGQAFADEIFRVYKIDHPEVQIHWINATQDVEKMVWRALANATPEAEK